MTIATVRTSVTRLHALIGWLLKRVVYCCGIPVMHRTKGGKGKARWGLFHGACCGASTHHTYRSLNALRELIRERHMSRPDQRPVASPAVVSGEP